MQRMCRYIANQGPIYMLRIKKCTNTRVQRGLEERGRGSDVPREIKREGRREWGRIRVCECVQISLTREESSEEREEEEEEEEENE